MDHVNGFTSKAQALRYLRDQGHKFTSLPDTRKRPMTPEQIIDAYDRNPDLTLATLARVSGWSVRELKTLLLEC